jgi:hypothetical protein
VRTPTFLINDKRDALARGLESAATSLHRHADSARGIRAPLATRAAANAMESAAGYVREHGVEDVVSDAKDLARRHPGAVLLTAAAVGFMLVRSMSRH